MNTFRTLAVISVLGLEACHPHHHGHEPKPIPPSVPSTRPLFPTRAKERNSTKRSAHWKRRLLYVDVFGLSHALPANAKLVLGGRHPEPMKELGQGHIQLFKDCDASGAAKWRFLLAGGASSASLSLCVVPVEHPDLDLHNCENGCSLVWSDGDLAHVPPWERPVVRVDAPTWKKLENAADGAHVCLKSGVPEWCD